MKKQVALITGSNSGFGLETALELGKAGYLVLATMRDTTKGEELLRRAKGLGLEEHIIVYPLDVTEDRSIQQVIAFLSNTLYRLDVLVNNAGYCMGGITEETHIKEWKKQFNTNVFGAVSLTQACLPFLRKSKGIVVNMGSISGQFGFPGMGPYVSSKFALRGFSETLRLEVAPLGVRVCLLEPGSYQTSIWKKGLERIVPNPSSPYTNILQNLYKQATRSHQNGGDPTEVAKAILSLCQKKHPPFRYPIGRGMNVFLFFKAVLPWSWVQWCVTQVLTKKEG